MAACSGDRTATADVCARGGFGDVSNALLAWEFTARKYHDCMHAFKKQQPQDKDMRLCDWQKANFITNQIFDDAVTHTLSICFRFAYADLSVCVCAETRGERSTAACC